MMPLKEKTTENEVKKKQDSEALKTEEILSLLSKTRQDFIKDKEILEKIPNLFKKKTLIELANSSENKKSKSQEIQKSEIQQKDEKAKIENESSVDKEEELEKKIEEKKYTEVEAKKMANDLAKEYYNKGYYLGVKKTKEELEKGEQALAVSLKNITDNIFVITPEFSEKITNTLNQKMSSIIKEILGYEIDTKTDFFVKKITELSEIFDENNKINIFLNENDYNSVKKFCSENKVNLNFLLLVDKSLQRGDLKIKSGSIEVSEIIDDKVKLSHSNTIKKDLNNLQHNANTLPKEEDKDLKRNSGETLSQKKEEHANS
jgi:flagellar biosynthesis/type III secretory pathway protein FliH